MTTKTPQEGGEGGPRTRSRASPKRYKDKNGRLYRIFALRLYDDEHERLAAEAAACETSLGRYVVERALNNPIPSYTDLQTVRELRRIGAMLKSLYPKDANWTNTDKRKYWAAMEEMMELSEAVRAKVA